MAAAGIRTGTRVCVERSKRTLIEFGDYLGCYFMDDRAPVAALLEAARVLGEREQRPADDVYFIFTTSAEVGGIGGSYASRTLPGDLTFALEVGPTEAEYATTVSGGPIVAYTDALSTFDKKVAYMLMKVADELQRSPQAAVLGAIPSDASHAKANGIAAPAGMLAIPRSVRTSTK